jgi:hypothetical protein
LIEADQPQYWPALSPESWQATRDTLHMWTQMVGKVRMALTPLVNHWWNVPLYVHARGLTTSRIPYEGKAFELRFDFIQHELILELSDGGIKELPLKSRSVADFYHDFLKMLSSAGIKVKLWRMPVELPNPIPFDEDRVHATYNPEDARRFWQVLVSVDAVFNQFRSGFIGKSSPVHFFWGSFDLAVSRFSGRRAPERPGADAMTREAYSHEVSSVGFWPGGGDIKDALFYSYTVPEPKGFRDAQIGPTGAGYDAKLGEFIIPYEKVRTARSPTLTLLEFCRNTYEAGANLGKWDRAALER